MLNVHNVKLLISAGNPSQFPKIPFGHVVMSGRSNVGKSSLINCLLNRKNFARISATPGKTATINFYEWDKKVLLVDLPGYGFANVSKERKKQWAALIDTYLHSEQKIDLIVQLIDIRHNPTKDDKLMMEWILSMGFPFVVVCTKSDKISKHKVASQVEIIRKELGLSDHAQILPFSCVASQGRDALLKCIEQSIEGTSL
jgi:GTP-binding protein